MITAKSQPFTPAYPWGTRTGTAARATAYRTKTSFVKDIFSHKFVNQKNNALALLFLSKIRSAKALKHTAL